MGRPILCIGTYAKNPFHIEKIGKNVYCIEELCYCIVQNAFLLDEDSFNKELFDWIAVECSLDELADELRSMLAKKCSVACFPVRLRQRRPGIRDRRPGSPVSYFSTYGSL